MHFEEDPHATPIQHCQSGRDWGAVEQQAVTLCTLISRHAPAYVSSAGASNNDSLSHQKALAGSPPSHRLSSPTTAPAKPVSIISLLQPRSFRPNTKGMEDGPGDSRCISLEDLDLTLNLEQRAAFYNYDTPLYPLDPQLSRTLTSSAETAAYVLNNVAGEHLGGIALTDILLTQAQVRTRLAWVDQKMPPVGERNRK